MKPLNNGFIFHIDIGPRLANCPNDNSIKNNGNPTIPSINIYGSRNAPIIVIKLELHIVQKIAYSIAVLILINIKLISINILHYVYN